MFCQFKKSLLPICSGYGHNRQDRGNWSGSWQGGQDGRLLFGHCPMDSLLYTPHCSTVVICTVWCPKSSNLARLDLSNSSLIRWWAHWGPQDDLGGDQTPSIQWQFNFRFFSHHQYNGNTISTFSTYINTMAIQQYGQNGSILMVCDIVR